MANKNHWEWVFGLSIDDELTWSAARIDVSTGVFTSNHSEVRQGQFRYPSRTGDVNLHKHLQTELRKLKKEQPNLFSDCIAVGVSTIGLADRSTNRLMSIARKNWFAKHDGCVVDFDALLREEFSNDVRISIQNDATAKCLAEYYWLQKSAITQNGKRSLGVDTMCYALFHEGVNGGFVNGNMAGEGRPVASLLHQEMGHIYPSLHPQDMNFDLAFSGCPVHGICFEGVASSERVRKQWGKPLVALRDHKDNPWEIISHYISHFCWNIILTIPPKRIFLGGCLIFPELLQLVRAGVHRLNVGQRKDPYIQYAEMKEPDFIDIALVPRGAEGQVGALELARLAVTDREPTGIDPLTDRGPRLVVDNTTRS